MSRSTLLVTLLVAGTTTGSLALAQGRTASLRAPVGAPLAGTPGAELTQHIASSWPNQAVASNLSADGSVLYQSQGSRLLALDTARLRENELGIRSWTLDEIITNEVNLYGSTMDLLEVDDTLWSCAGDSGLFTVARTLTPETVRLVERHPRGLWCMDAAVGTYRGRTRVLALWSGYGDSELRVYTVGGTHVATVPLNADETLTRDAVGWAVETRGHQAYIAMGASGLARVNWVRAALGSPVRAHQGPLAIAADVDRFTAQLQRVRDLTLAGGYLYAAADAQGLVSIDLRQPWGDDMATEVHFADQPYVDQYPVRVAAWENPDGSVLVAAGVSYAPSTRVEWGPYTHYANFDWETLHLAEDIDVLDVFVPGEEQDFETGGTRGPYLFERINRNAPLTLLTHGETDSSWNDGINFGSLSMQRDDDGYWMYTQAPTVWHWDDDPAAPVTRSLSGQYVGGHGGYSTGVRSQIDPTVILAGSDGGPHSLHRLEGSEPTFTPVPDTYDYEHKLGLWVQYSWLSGGSEMFIAGGAGETWQIHQADFSGEDIDISTWIIPVGLVPYDDSATDAFGYNPRSYSTSAMDEKSDLIALFRSQARAGTVLTTRSAILEATRNVPPYPTGSDEKPHVVPEILAELVLHAETPEDADIWAEKGEDPLYALRGHFFDDAAGNRTLGVAAGTFADTTSEDYRRPKAVFYDVEGWSPGLPVPQAVMLGNRGPGHAMDMETFSMDGEHFAVMADTSGSVSLHSLGRLAQVLAGDAPARVLEPISTWQMALRPLDQHTTPCSDVEVRIEEAHGASNYRVYAACNRAGVFVLEIQPTATRLELRQIDHINTYYQALSLSTADVEGQELLLVFDHGGGISAFGAE